MNFIDNFLDRITMYRLVLYYLAVLSLVALLLSIFGLLYYPPANLLTSLAVLLLASWVSNTLFAKLFSVTPNVESVYITAFILFCIVSPVAITNLRGMGIIAFIAILAMGSKYILAIGKKHLFNPAAFGVAAAALILGQGASWWVGSNIFLLPFVAIGGILVVRKIQHEDLVLSFLITTVVISLFTTSGGYGDMLYWRFISSSFCFFALVMLTEPLTTPPSRPLRIIYGALVGLLYLPSAHIGSFDFTPALALLAGNIFAYLVSPKGRYVLTLVEKRTLATNTLEYVFASDRELAFRAGQYLEWTLGHSPSDARGNRRYFTIASSPTENVVRLGVKFYEPSSTFKKALSALSLGETITIGGIAGDFVLPKDRHKKLAFIAGGIGITPFRSMVQYLIDKEERRDAVLFYGNNSEADIAYKDFFDTAMKEIGLKTVYTTLVDRALIERETPDYKDRIFYISGPNRMVEAFKKTLHEMGVPRAHIRSDYFPGYA